MEYNKIQAIMEPKNDQLTYEFLKVFIMADAAKNTKISYYDLSQLIKNVAQIDNLLVTKDDIQKIFQTMDQAGNGFITWPDFYKTIKEWLLITNTYQALQQKFQYNIPLTKIERAALHKIISAFFIQNKRISYNSVITHQKYLERIENQIYHITTLGQIIYTTNIVEKEEMLEQVKICLNDFNTITQEVYCADVGLILQGVGKLLTILSIFSVFHSKQELMEILPIITKIFELILSANIPERLIAILSYHDTSIQLVTLKILIVRCLGFLSFSNKVLSDGNLVAKLVERENLLKTKVIIENLAEVITKCLIDDNIDLKDAGIMTLGLVIHNDIDLGAYLFQYSQISFLFELIHESQNIVLMKRICWTLVSISSKYFTQPLFMAQYISLDGIAEKMEFLLYWNDDEELLCYTIMIYNNILHLCSATARVKNIGKRILSLNSHPKPSIQKISLLCLRSLILNSDVLTQDLLDMELVNNMTKRINSNDSMEIKLESLHIIYLVAFKGHFPKLMQTSLITAMFKVINEDKSFLWEVIKILECLSHGSKSYISFLVEEGVIKVLFNYLESFKEFDDSFGNSYGFLGSINNLCFLKDVFQTADNILSKGFNSSLAVAGGKSNFNSYLEYFNRECLERIRSVIQICCEDPNFLYLEETHLYLRNSGPIEKASDIIKTFLLKLREGYFHIESEISRSIITLINNLLNQLQIAFSGEKIIFSNENGHQLYSSNEIMEVKCFSSDNFPNGDNRVLDLPLKISFKELFIKIQEKYRNPGIGLEYVDDETASITIDSDDVLKKAVFQAIDEASKLNQNKIRLKLIVSTAKVPELINEYQCFECGHRFEIDGEIIANQRCPNCNELI